MSTKITLGMATHRDYDGVYFTIQAARLYHHIDAYIVVDNAPDSPEGQATAKFLRRWVSEAKYIPMPEPVGTSAPRDRVFFEAEDGVVICVDSHVLLAPGAIDSIRNYFAANPDSNDLIHGPLLHDDLKNKSTHFTNVWSNDMWGQWGYDQRCEMGEPFEILAQGLGLFACRKSAWLGFHPDFRGFGGEEWYVHEKYRKFGRKVLCLPGLCWAHRFGRPGGVPYPLRREDRIRNYIIGLNELNIPLDDAHKHFVIDGGFPQADWDALLNSKNISKATAKQGCGGCGRTSDQQPVAPDWEQIYSRVKMDHPAADLTRFNAYGLTVEIAPRRAWHFVATLLSSAEEIVSITDDTPEATPTQPANIAGKKVTLTKSLAEPIECDMLCVYHYYDADKAYNLLLLWHSKVKGRIILPSGGMYGQGAGWMPAIRRFLRERREWTVMQKQAEFILLTKLNDDKKKLPSWGKRIANAALSTWRNAAVTAIQDGPASKELVELRLAVCDECPSRNGSHCGECGCPVERKATWPEERCPLERWEQ